MLEIIVAYFGSEGVKGLIRPYIARSLQQIGLVPQPPGSDLAERLQGIERQLETIRDQLEHDRLAKFTSGIALLRNATLSRAKEPIIHLALGRLHEIAELPLGGSTGGRSNRELKALAHLALAQCHFQLDDPDELLVAHIAHVFLLDIRVAEEAFGRSEIPAKLREILGAHTRKEASKPLPQLALTSTVGTRFREINAPWCPTMVVLPTGSYVRGGKAGMFSTVPNDEQPQHRVTINYPIAIGIYAVTFDEFDAFVEATGFMEKPHDYSGRGNKPVTVHWKDAQEYCKWLSRQLSKRYRLPSEAEWEYACRAGTSTAYWFGDKISAGKVNYKDGGTSGSKTVNVDEYAPNPFGLYQTHGNVFEWCQDTDQWNYINAPTDGRAWEVSESTSSGSRVARGGSFRADANACRSGARGNMLIGRISEIGFRVVCDL